MIYSENEIYKEAYEILTARLRAHIELLSSVRQLENRGLFTETKQIVYTIMKLQDMITESQHIVDLIL